MRMINTKKLNFWPVYLKNPKENNSSYVLSSIIQSKLSVNKIDYKIESVYEVTDLTYCPLTKIYIKHKSFNTGVENHFIKYNQDILGSIVVCVNEDYISSWGRQQIQERIISLIRNSFNSVEIVSHENPNLYQDLHSLRIVIGLLLEVKGEDVYQTNVRVYFDVAHDFSDIILKEFLKGAA